MKIPSFKSSRIIAPVIFALGLANTTGSVAEEIAIPAGSQGNASVITPDTGTTKSSVANHFGQPDESSASIGEPPISRWEYDQFFVYFEHDRVIHSVLKK